MNGKYCILSGIYPPDIGGPAKFAETFSEFLRARKSEVRIISYRDGTSQSITKSGIRFFFTSRQLPILFRYMRVIFQILKSTIRRETIIANGCFIEILIAKFLFPIKYVAKIPGDIVWERARNQNLTSSTVDEYQLENLGWKYRFFRKMFSLSLKWAVKVIVPSIHLKNLAILWGVDPKKIHLIHNSINSEEFTSSQTIEKHFDVLTVSRLVPWKGIEEVIEVCASLGLTLGVVGDGPLRAKLEKLAIESMAAVKFFGDVQQANLVEIYSKSELFVLNSNFEATSYALLEAMSCGLVPISNDSTGSAEVIQHAENGILCGSSTNMNLKEALRFLMDNKSRKIEMSAKARSRIQANFDIQANYGLIEELLSV